MMSVACGRCVVRITMNDKKHKKKKPFFFFGGGEYDKKLTRTIRQNAYPGDRRLTGYRVPTPVLPSNRTPENHNNNNIILFVTRKRRRGETGRRPRDIIAHRLHALRMSTEIHGTRAETDKQC